MSAASRASPPGDRPLPSRATPGHWHRTSCRGGGRGGSPPTGRRCAGCRRTRCRGCRGRRRGARGTVSYPVRRASRSRGGAVVGGGVRSRRRRKRSETERGLFGRLGGSASGELLEEELAQHVKQRVDLLFAHDRVGANERVEEGERLRRRRGWLGEELLKEGDEVVVQHLG